MALPSTTPPPDSTLSADAVADRIHSAAIHLLRRLREADLQSGLSSARLSALSVIVFGGPMSLTLLAKTEQVTPATMSKIAKALEEDRLVSRRHHPSDARVTLLRATPKGNRLLRRARERRVGMLAARLQELETRDRAAVLRAADLLDRMAIKVDARRG